MPSYIEAEQLQLQNIFSVAQDKLQNNFKLILQTLREHSRLISQNAQSISLNTLARQNAGKGIFQQSEPRLLEIQNKLKVLQNQIDQNYGSIQENKQQMESNKKKTEEFNEKLVSTQSFQQQQLLNKKNEINQLNSKSLKILSKIHNLQEALMKKENVSDAEKLAKKIEELNKRNYLAQSEIKLLQFKFQKIEIMNQKAERVKFMNQKDGEKKVKKTSRILQKSVTFHHDQNQQTKIKKEEEDDFERQYLTNSLNVEKSISGVNQKVGGMQNRIREVQEAIRNIKEQNHRNKNSDFSVVVEKINQLKPEMIKLWAKIDVFEDRLSFIDRKLEEKTKVIHSLVEYQKENTWSKIQDKIKTMQTQMHASNKDIKLKIQAKLATQDFEKYIQQIQSKLKHMSDQIFVKSDKTQVKKALLFLQSKIKQIILVISEDQEDQKDALLTKKQLKCISCDKEVQAMNTNQTRGNWDNLPCRELVSESLGKFGMTHYGSLSKKLKRLQAQDLPIIKKTKKESNSFNHS